MTTDRGMAQEITTRSRSNSATPVATTSTHNFSNFTNDASDLHWVAEATAWTETLAQCAESPPLGPTFAS
jgi:glucose-6-phosphate dehydrogenase assembly protein OpcA